MTTNIFAARLPCDDTPIQKVPLIVNFWRAESLEVTYIRLSTELDAKRENPSFIASIPVNHPAGIIVDETNWAGFLYLDLIGREKMKKSFTIVENVRGCRSVRSHLSFGYYYFEIDSLYDGYGILVDRPTSVRPMRQINPAVIIESPYGQKRSSVFYNDRAVYFGRGTGINPMSAAHDIYSGYFNEPLDEARIMNIYRHGVSQLDVSKIPFHDAVDDWDLEYRHTRGFQYFKSFDHEVVFTIQANCWGKAFAAVQSLVEGPEAIANETYREVVREEYRDLTVKYVLSDDEGRLDVLRNLIGLLEVYANHHDVD